MNYAWISLLLTSLLQAKTVVINLVFDLEGVKNEGNFFSKPYLPGVSKDLQSYRDLANQAGLTEVYNFTQTQMNEFNNKTEFLNHLANKIESADRVVFNYSGHGVLVPRESSMVVNSPDQITTQNTELLFVDQKIHQCLNSNKKDLVTDKVYSQTLKLCLDESKKEIEVLKSKLPKVNGKPILSAELMTKSFVDQDQCLSNAWAALGLGHYSNMIRNERFYGNNKDCFDKYGLVSSDLEKLLKDKEIYMHIDACLSGIIKDFKFKAGVISTSSEWNELSEDSVNGGTFTRSKMQELKVNPCAIDLNKDGQVSLSEWYGYSVNSHLFPKNQKTGAATMTPVTQIKSDRLGSEPIILLKSYDADKCISLQQYTESQSKIKSPAGAQ